MIAGTLAALTLVMLFVPHSTSLTAARAAAMMATAIGIGRSMTYGQTVDLTHDHEIVGNVEALCWECWDCPSRAASGLDSEGFSQEWDSAGSGTDLWK